MSKIMTTESWLKVKNRLDELSRTRKPTKKFNNIQEVLNIIKNIMHEEDAINIEYGYTNCTIQWITALVSLYNDSLADFSKLVSLVDSINIAVTADEEVFFEIMISSVFDFDR